MGLESPLGAMVSILQGLNYITWSLYLLAYGILNLLTGK